MDEITSMLEIAKLGLTAFQTMAIIALWRDRQKDSSFIQALLMSQLENNQILSRAQRERQKIAQAVGANFDDTEGKRPKM